MRASGKAEGAGQKAESDTGMEEKELISAGKAVGKDRKDRTAEGQKRRAARKKVEETGVKQHGDQVGWNHLKMKARHVRFCTCT